VDCSVDEELVGWLPLECRGQQLNVQMETDNKWCSSGLHMVTTDV